MHDEQPIQKCPSLPPKIGVPASAGHGLASICVELPSLANGYTNFEKAARNGGCPDWQRALVYQSRRLGGEGDSR